MAARLSCRRGAGNPVSLLASSVKRHIGAESPIDRSRTLVPSYKGAKQLLELPQSLTQALIALSHVEGVTLFMTLLATFRLYSTATLSKTILLSVQRSPIAIAAR